MTDSTPHARRGDRVTAISYHGVERVTGKYMPREEHLASDPPHDAAWVDTGDPQGPIMVGAGSVQRLEAESPARADLRAVRDAAQSLADAVRVAIRNDLSDVPRIILPRIQWPFPEGEPEPVDERHTVVSVLGAPTPGGRLQTRTFGDDAGLTWQTYGTHDDFSQDRMLEIHNGNGEIVATYAPGTWLEVQYTAYARPPQVEAQ